MNARSVKTFLLAIVLLSSPAGARAQGASGDGQEGELRLYDRPTEIGTTANRVFKDAKGRIVKTIYYTGGGLPGSPGDAGGTLREQSIRVMTYDDYNCPVKDETFEPGMKLTHMTETRCRKGTAEPDISIGRNGRGVKQSETRHGLDCRTHTSLYFDDEGERVVSIWGDTPPDVDLAQGWGKEVAGFTSGIAASRERGRQSELRVWVTIKNIGHRGGDGLALISPVAFELRDAAGRLVAPKASFEETFDEGAAAACPTNEARGVPRAGASELLRSYELGERYGRLPPGTYSVTVKHCLSTKRQLIVSNTIHVEVM